MLQVTSLGSGVQNGFKRMNLNKINQVENYLQFIQLISFMADFQKPLILFEKI
jgi:hypothetical protein